MYCSITKSEHLYRLKKRSLRISGNQRDWFLRQLRHDVSFLRDLGVQDYSLLLGRHELHKDDQQKTFVDLVDRMRKYVSYGTLLFVLFKRY